jgi:hypothetical protein
MLNSAPGNRKKGSKLELVDLQLDGCCSDPRDLGAFRLGSFKRGMSTIGNSSRSAARRSAFGLLLAALLLSVVAIPAGAEASVPGGATNLSISAETARLVGPEALISVECEGPRDGLCNGTLTVSKGGQTRTAPFSVFAGSHQSLPISVGQGFAGSGGAAVAIARTAQAAGGYAQSRAVIHFR